MAEKLLSLIDGGPILQQRNDDNNNDDDDDEDDANTTKNTQTVEEWIQTIKVINNIATRFAFTGFRILFVSIFLLFCFFFRFYLFYLYYFVYYVTISQKNRI